MAIFQYHPDVLAAFPGVTGGVIVAGEVRNGPSPDALGAIYRAEQRAVLDRLGDRSLSEIPALAAWRAAFRAFGVEPTQYRSAAEALLRRLTKKGDIPSINTLVDLGNLISLRYALPVAVFDRRGIQGTMTVRFAGGSEPFRNLNNDEVEYPAPGEVIFADEAQRVLARRWCWRQADEVAARDDSAEVVITVEAHHAGGQADVEAAVRDLLALLDIYAGGRLESAILSVDRPAV